MAAADFLVSLFEPRPRRGSVFFAMLVLGLYCGMMWQWNSDIKRQAMTREFVERVVKWVATQPARPGGYTLAELQQAQVISAEDLEFLEEQGYEYRPIGPDDPPEAVLLVEHKSSLHDEFYYKDGSSDYQRSWPGPRSELVLLDQPAGHQSTKRRLCFQDGGKVLGEYQTDGHYRKVYWNADGCLAAMDAKLEGREHELTLWQVNQNQAAVVELPAELSLDRILSRETDHRDTNWGMNFLEIRGWSGPRELLLNAQGNGVYMHPQTGKKMSFNVIYNVLLEVQGQRCVVKGLQKRHFAQSEYH